MPEVAGAADELQRTLAALQDLEAIQRLKHAYFRCIDTGDLAGLRPLLHQDIVVEFIGGSHPTVVRGREPYLEFVAALINPRMVAQHTGHHPEIDLVSATEATGTWYLHGQFWRLWDKHHVSGSALYRDRYVRLDGRWQIYASRYESLCEIDGIMERPPPLTAHYLGRVRRPGPTE